MKPKRNTGTSGTRGAGASSSASSGKRPRGRPPKHGVKKPSHASEADKKSKPSSVTAARVASIIAQLDNKRGSTMESIRSKLLRSGHQTNTSLVRKALERAVKAGILKEVREERFSLPANRSGSSSSTTNSSSSRSRNNSVKRMASVGQRKLKTSPSTAQSERRQRRPPQGRRPAANSDNGGSADSDDARDARADDETGVGDGNVNDQGNESGLKNASSRVSVAEPVAGCDAVMVFGTH